MHNTPHFLPDNCATLLSGFLPPAHPISPHPQSVFNSANQSHHSLTYKALHCLAHRPLQKLPQHLPPTPLLMHQLLWPRAVPPTFFHLLLPLPGMLFPQICALSFRSQIKHHLVTQGFPSLLKHPPVPPDSHHTLCCHLVLFLP